MNQLQMNKKEIGKEIETLIRSIKLHYDNIAEEVRIPTIELELITAKIRKLHEKSIVFNHLHMIEEQMNKMKRLEQELNNTDDESSEENFIINANELSTPLSIGSRIPAEANNETKFTNMATPSPEATVEPIIETISQPTVETTQVVEPVETTAIADPEPVKVAEVTAETNSVEIPATSNVEPIVATAVAESKPIETPAAPTPAVSESTELVGKDLKKIIGFSDKYFFISQLFAGNADHFNGEISKLNMMQNLSAAQAHLEALTQARAWNKDAEAYQSLSRYIQNKFN